MYRIHAGLSPSSAPNTPVERAEYFLEQMKIYLSINNKQKEEYRQVQCIFNAFLNLMTETHFQKIVEMVSSLTAKIGTRYGRADYYWQEFLTFANYKLGFLNKFEK